MAARRRYAILGAGRQGTAAAFDVARFDPEAEVRIADRERGLAEAAAARVGALAGRADAASGHALDARDARAAAAFLDGTAACLSAVPYFLNAGLAAAAVEAGASFCDLGGNTEVVRQELALDAAARERGVTVVPDCGLAPGMANTLAAHLVQRLEREHGARPRAVAIRCGGLPQRPRPPLGYQLVFAIEGLTNEYTGSALVLRGGRVAEVPTLEEVEAIDFPEPIGRCEAFTTSGGTSTCPYTYEGKLESYDYKNVRYPGHVEKIRLLRDLGLLDLEPPVELTDAGTGAAVRVAPRALLHRVLAPRLTFPGEKDLVVLRVTARGELADGRGPVEIAYDLLDRHDEATGFTAMERTTAFPAAIVLRYLASGDAEKGAVPLERAVPGDLFLRELARRGIAVTETVRRPAAG